jgi:hypothetical protein
MASYKRGVQDKLVRDALHGSHWAAERIGESTSLLKIGDKVQINRTKEISVIVGLNKVGDYILAEHDPKWGFPASALRKLK